MVTIRYAGADDKPFWRSLDGHIAESILNKKIQQQTCYILELDHTPVALLRYNLFWDNTPFCTLLSVSPAHQRRGYGKQLMEHWEQEMKHQGFGMVMTSTQVDEEAQHFYRKLGYRDAGGFVIDIPGFVQPMELIMIKAL